MHGTGTLKLILYYCNYNNFYRFLAITGQTTIEYWIKRDMKNNPERQEEVMSYTMYGLIYSLNCLAIITCIIWRSQETQEFKGYIRNNKYMANLEPQCSRNWERWNQLGNYGIILVIVTFTSNITTSCSTNNWQHLDLGCLNCRIYFLSCSKDPSKSITQNISKKAFNRREIGLKVFALKASWFL